VQVKQLVAAQDTVQAQLGATTIVIAGLVVVGFSVDVDAVIITTTITIHPILSIN
jgi:hypothetical protein